MVTRDNDAIAINTKWAATGDVSTPASQGITFAEGFDSTYSTVGGNLPEREVFNWLIRAFTSIMTELNAHGVLIWDASLEYVHPAMVFGSDGVIYASVRDSTSVDPTTDTNDDDWTRLVPTQAATFDASAIVSGVLALTLIPNLPASKIMSGTLDPDRIPALSASTIASGTLGADRLPFLITTASPTQTQIDSLPEGGLILVRSTSAYTP